MGSGSVGQRARLETAEVCSREELERLDSRDTEREMEFGTVCRSDTEGVNGQRGKKNENV